jgi:hypothetical protein
MSASNISTIDWELIGKAFTNLTTAKKRRVRPLWLWKNDADLEISGPC